MAFVKRKGLNVSNQSATGVAGKALEENWRDVGDRLEQSETDITERPRLLTVAITGFDGDPNVGAPLIITNAPFGTTYQQITPLATEWRKDPSGLWIDQTVTGLAGKLDTVDKGLLSLVTTTDGDLATSTVVSTALVTGGSVEVFVSSIKVSVGDGVKTEECYFSTDGGSTALLRSAIVAGATLHWVASVATYQLDGTEKIDFIYVVP